MPVYRKKFLYGKYNFFVLQFHLKKSIDKVNLVCLVDKEGANNTKSSLDCLNYYRFLL